MKKHLNKILLLTITIQFLFSCSNNSSDSNNSNPNPSSTKVTIGSQIWMARNLDVDHYQNGDPIPQVTSQSQFLGLTTGAWCYYNNDPANGTKYGKLYNWYAVNDSRGLTPIGYHIPNDTEWTTLFTYLGGLSLAGGAMKEAGSTNWLYPNTGATNSSGFTALPAGTLDGSGAYYFTGINRVATWWSVNESSQQDVNSSNFNLYAHSTSVNCTNPQAYLSLGGYKRSGMSVRCIKD
jgi:uncharacterized protein (TIGR02145 family)